MPVFSGRSAQPWEPRLKPKEIIAQARRSGRSALDEVAAKRLLTSFAIPIPRSVIARDAADVAEKAR